MKIIPSLLAVGISVGNLMGSTRGAAPPTLEQRVRAQRAIETVYWSRRIWPGEGRAPKPPLSSVMTDAAIRAKVEGYLSKSFALDIICGQRVDHQPLQAGLERIAARTKDASTLRELFAALDNDPRLIAETLLRPILVDRMLRQCYSEHARDSASGRGIPFDAWWRQAASKVPPGLLMGSSEAFSLPPLASPGCTNDTWSPTSTSPDVAPRWLHTAVWTGAEMIVWGGLDAAGGTALPTGGRYDPATDSWSPTLEGGSAPSGRYGHTAVWTGTEMIVWGGTDGADDLNTGGRYNPATDAWSTMSLGDAPSPRQYHTAVWTGTRMIVWGGQPLSGLLNTGGRYDPLTDTWVPTSLASGVPSARSAHVAVWTGREMVVWGGWDGTHASTGGRYDPVTDTWTATQDAGAPQGRYFATAVWTGSEMIVWGGYAATPYWNAPVDTGGRYEPATDSWRAVSSRSGSPPPNAEHSAVWTGSEMIVWGGYAGVGGRYEPSADAWTPMSFPPEIYQNGEAGVWSGTGMIVWGGRIWTGWDWACQGGGSYCAEAACTVQTWYSDDDGDGHGLATDAVLSCTWPAGYVPVGDDCDDADGGTWGTPGEVTGLILRGDATALEWSPPVPMGANAPAYDTLRSVVAGDFVNGAVCVESDDGADTVATDSAVPSVHAVFYYLIRAESGCPGALGVGPLGAGSGGTPRAGRACR